MRPSPENLDLVALSGRHLVKILGAILRCFTLAVTSRKFSWYSVLQQTEFLSCIVLCFGNCVTGTQELNCSIKLEWAASNGNIYPPYPQVMATAISQKWLPPSFAPNFMSFVPSDLSANAQPPENAVNEQTDRWTDRQTNNNIHKHPWMLSVSHLDTSACQIVGHFFQALCMQYTNPSPWMVGRTDERMKWQQYPSASMLAKGKSSGNIYISNSMPFLPSDLSANVQKPENVVNRPIDGQTDGQTDGQKSGRGALLLGGIAMAPSTWFRRIMW